MRGKADLALDTMERVLTKEIPNKPHLVNVSIILSCSLGGITNVGVDYSERGLCSFNPSDPGLKKTDDPDKARRHFTYLLEKIDRTNHSGEMTFVVLCQAGRVYNTKFIEEFTNLFSMDDSKQVMIEFGR